MTSSATASVRAGSYTLECGPASGSFARFEPERDGSSTREISAALTAPPGGHALVDAIEELQLDAATVTDRIQRAHELFGAAAEGRLLERGVLTVEVDALLRLLGELDREGRLEEQLRLMRALYGLLLLLMRWLDLARTLRATLKSAQTANNQPGQAWALHELGTLHLCAGDPKTAEELLGEALEIEKKLGHVFGECPTRHNLDCARRESALQASIERWPHRLLRLAGLVAVLSALGGGGTAVAFAVSHSPKQQASRHFTTAPDASPTHRTTNPRPRPPTPTGRTASTALTTTAGPTTSTQVSTTTPTTTATPTVSTAIESPTLPQDTSGPSVTFDAPADSLTNWAPAPTFSGTAGTEPGDESWVVVTIRDSTGNQFGATYKAPVSSDGTWTLIPIAEPPDGTYTASAHQDDAAGNPGGDSNTISLTVDTTKPYLKLSCPDAPIHSITPGPVCTVSSTESGPALLKISEITQDPNSPERQTPVAEQGVALISGAPTQVTLTLPDRGHSGIGYSLFATQLDPAGNRGDSNAGRIDWLVVPS